MACRSLVTVAATFVLIGCAPASQPAASPAAPTGSAAEGTTPAVATYPAVFVRADGTILIGEQLTTGPADAVERMRPYLTPDMELEIFDRSDGGTSLMTLVAEFRKAGVERIVVRFEAPPPAPPPSAAPPSDDPPPPPPPPPGAGSLPEVRVRNVGLHIGGGPNDDATKAPFQAAVARHFGELRGCYRLVGKPGSGGVFGVDLRIPSQGGKPTIQAKRTAMGGEQFRQCVLDVFARVEFEPPPRGPTVISYSVRFEIGD
jgi:hypothetical protein